MYLLLKRSFDIFLQYSYSSFVSIIFANYDWIEINIRRRYFYFQERIGYNKKPFLILKFATMLKNSENMKGGIMTVEK